MPTPHAPAGSSPRQLVSPRERIYYGAMLLLSVTVYAECRHSFGKERVRRHQFGPSDPETLV